jgi:hypothetical protein
MFADLEFDSPSIADVQAMIYLRSTKVKLEQRQHNYHDYQSCLSPLTLPPPHTHGTETIGMNLKYGIVIALGTERTVDTVRSSVIHS